VYSCIKYITLNICKSFIILNDKNETLKYNNIHNHLKKKKKKKRIIIHLYQQHNIKLKKKNLNPLDIKPKVYLIKFLKKWVLDVLNIVISNNKKYK